MSDPFLGEIRMFAGNFAPRSYALCDGGLTLISQNDALFSLLGTIYGGDGRTTFGLPDLRGRIPIHAGAGPSLSSRVLGARGGSEAVALSTSELPVHGHTAQAVTASADSSQPAGRVHAGNTPIDVYKEQPTPTVSMDPAAVGIAGAGQTHSNLQPFLCVNFIIALAGTFPSRN